MELDEQTKKAFADFMQHRKDHTGWKNYDEKMVLSALIRLGISAYHSDCWGHASVAITDEGGISMRG